MSDPTTGRWDRRAWALLFVLSGNMLLDSVEVSIVIVSMPSIGTGVGLPLVSLQWVMSGFALGFGGSLLWGGRVTALLGRRRAYLGALLVFAAASVLGGLTGDGTVLIATRFVKGFCAALTAPTGLAIIAATFPEGRARNRAVAVYSLFGAGGFAVGLLLSGVFTGVSWRWTIAFPAPVALALFAAGLLLIPRDRRDVPGRPRLDLAGALTFAAAAVLAVYGVVHLPVVGWADPRSVGALGLAGALLVVFVVVERLTPQPLARPGLVANRPLVRSAVGAATLNGSYWGFLLVATLDLQESRHWSPLRTALALLPASALLSLAAPFSGRLVGRFGAARLIAAGAAAPPVGYALYLRFGGPHASPVSLIAALLLVGLGFALSFAALHVQATSAALTAEQPMVGGVYQTAVQIGGALTVALVTAALVGGAPRGHPSPPAHEAAVVAGQHRALALITGVGAVGLLVALAGARPPRRAAGAVPADPGRRRRASPR